MVNQHGGLRPLRGQGELGRREGEPEGPPKRFANGQADRCPQVLEGRVLHHVLAHHESPVNQHGASLAIRQAEAEVAAERPPPVQRQDHRPGRGIRQRDLEGERFVAGEDVLERPDLQVRTAKVPQRRLNLLGRLDRLGLQQAFGALGPAVVHVLRQDDAPVLHGHGRQAQVHGLVGPREPLRPSQAQETLLIRLQVQGVAVIVERRHEDAVGTLAGQDLPDLQALDPCQRPAALLLEEETLGTPHRPGHLVPSDHFGPDNDVGVLDRVREIADADEAAHRRRGRPDNHGKPKDQTHVCPHRVRLS